jgi:hypothetical protein
LVVTVLPLVVVVAAGGGGLALGGDFSGARGVLRAGALFSGAGAAGCAAATSFNWGCDVESRFAIAR